MKSGIPCMILLLFCAFVLCAGAPAANASPDELPALHKLLTSCREAGRVEMTEKFSVPRTWTLDPSDCRAQLEKMAKSGTAVERMKASSPHALVASAIEAVLRYHEKHGAAAPLNLRTGEGVVAVSALPRLLSMYDFDGDGLIGTEGAKDITLNAQGVREMGTFVKNILVLPYLKALGYNTVHFQPITEIGLYGRKGNVGSPFAISDPFSIDARLHDPLFAGTAEEQYLAFVEAAHALGMKVVQEVIPRTVSIDSKILMDHPDYGYWVKDGSPRRMPNYYSPDYEYATQGGKRRFPDRASFEKWFFNEYKDKIYGGRYVLEDLIDVTKTDPEYTGFFMPAPDVVMRESNGKLAGFYWKKDASGNKLRGEIDDTMKSEVLPAFCDTPFEIQPFWADVTYLRLYDDVDGTMPMLRPLSFVTAKFFKDVEPAVEKRYRYQPVWGMITGCFDKFKSLGVDGFVLDMGHALPEELKVKIRSVLPNVWEENLGVGFPYLANTQVVVTGNVFAYVMPSYSDRTEMRLYEEHPMQAVRFHIKGMRKLATEMSRYDGYAGRMFGTPDNYNTKRMGLTPATRDLSRAPKRKGTDVPDFTLAPVDPVKARRITLLYDTLFRLLSAKEGTPFVLNPVFGTEFIPTSTINVGLSTHIEESNRFLEYMAPEARTPDAPRLLLMSKPVRQGEEWTGTSHIIREILETNRAIERLRPLLKKAAHLEVLDAGKEEVLFLSCSEPARRGRCLGIAANLDLEQSHVFTLPARVGRFHLNAPKGGGKEAMLAPGTVMVFTYSR